MTLTPIAERFILHWGEMGSRWGVNRTVAQIHALLYLLCLLYTSQGARGVRQRVQARRHFLRRAHLAAREIGLRMVQFLVVVEVRLHAC